MDSYSVTVAVHSRDAISYDWLDSVAVFQVVSPVAMEGVANLNATATVRRFAQAVNDAETAQPLSEEIALQSSS